MKKLLLVMVWLLGGAAWARPLAVTCDRDCQVSWRRLEGDTQWQPATSLDGRRFSLDLPFEEVEVRAQDQRQWWVLWSDTQRVGTTRSVLQLQLQRSLRAERIGLLLLVLGVAPMGAALTWRWRQAQRTTEQLQQALAESSREILSAKGQRVGDYLLEEQVGRGGMGVVYRATRGEDGLPAAVKLMSCDPGDEVYRARFQRECSLSSRLHHPNLVAVYDYGEQDGVLYLVMEWIEGRTLRQCIGPKGLPLERALPWMRELLEGVAYCHGQSLVHCDLKPENVMIDERNRVKVLDFGLARDPNLTRITPLGSVLGTPSYLAPERYREPESKPDASVDQYALGVMFYEMLTGQTPFFSRDVGDLGRLHQQAVVPPLLAKRPELPPGLCRMISRMLGKRPAERYPDLCAILDVLQEVSVNPPPTEESTIDLRSARD